MRQTLAIFGYVLAMALVAGLTDSAVYGQGSSLFGSTGSGSSTSSSASRGGSTNMVGSSSSVAGASGSTGSSSSLFNTGSGSSTGSTGSGGGSTGSTGSNVGNSGTTIQQAAIGSGPTPLTRGDVLGRGVSGASLSGQNLVNANNDLIGGQTNNRNQFANLFSQLGRQMNQGNYNQSATKVRPAIRIPLKIAFTPKPVSMPQFTAKFSTRMAKLPGISAVGPIQITMEGPTAVLRGVVATEADRELAAGVAMLEPEVESVQNELTVQGAGIVPAELVPPKTTP